MPKSERVKFMYPIFKKQKVLGEKPVTWVDKKQRDWMVESGGAVPINRGKALRLTRDKVIGDSSDMRDCSSQMGPSVIEANADRKKWAEAIVEEWAKTGIPRMRAACKG